MALLTSGQRQAVPDLQEGDQTSHGLPDYEGKTQGQCVSKLNLSCNVSGTVPIENIIIVPLSLGAVINWWRVRSLLACQSSVRFIFQITLETRDLFHGNKGY